MQYGGEGDWNVGDVAAHNAVQPVLKQIERLQAELARERARVDTLRDLLISYGASRELHPELWE